MKDHKDAIDFLKNVKIKHVELTSMFNYFQEAICRLGEKGYPVEGIHIERSFTYATLLAFAGRSYRILFDWIMVDSNVKGRITCFRKNNDEETKVSSIIFSQSGNVEDFNRVLDEPMSLEDNNACEKILLNFLCSDAEKSTSCKIEV